jgi:hypothetical protein
MSQIEIIAIVAGSIGAIILGGFAISKFSKKTSDPLNDSYDKTLYTDDQNKDFDKMDAVFERGRRENDKSGGKKNKSTKKRNYKSIHHKSNKK